MDDLREGDEVLIRATVTREGVRVGDKTLPAGDVDVVADIPKFPGIFSPLAVLLFFSHEDDRREFAAAFTGCDHVQARHL